MHNTINLCIYVNASEKHESMKETETADFETKNKTSKQYQCLRFL
jgi:hypothetical protein